MRLHATHSHDRRRFGNDLVLVAEVTDEAAAPVTSLRQEDFECWQPGLIGFGPIRDFVVSHLGDASPSLAGMYHLIPRIWEMYAETQCAFTVVFRRTGDDGEEEAGRGTTTVVTQGEQD